LPLSGPWRGLGAVVLALLFEERDDRRRILRR